MRRTGLDVVVAGLSVVDVIGRVVDLRELPRRGGLQLIESITMTSGGNVPNCGIDLSRLGCRVGAITRVGRDDPGDYVLGRLRAHRMDTAGVEVDPALQTSATIVAVDGDGERTFFHTRGCMTRFRARTILDHLHVISRSRFLAFGYLGLLPEIEPDLPRVFRRIRRATSADVLLDTGGNPVYNPSLLSALLPSVDYFIPSHDEAIALTGEKRPEDIVRFLFASGVRQVAGVKMGADGCYVATRTEGCFLPASRVRRVVDATGAGDAFVAGFLAGLVRNMPPFTAARFANQVAASCVTAVGASTGIRPFSTYPLARTL